MDKRPVGNDRALFYFPLISFSSSAPSKFGASALAWLARLVACTRSGGGVPALAGVSRYFLLLAKNFGVNPDFLKLNYFNNI
ncbi:MAG: hypothetical protein EOO37_03290 [Cytophagaceae bacterium]|nr:MAG: hypothetical protein EOO37_03290 [Cytophagaceae bacterium]